ncbi:hypothetical protein GN958_ATG04718 [Phytophthora infestans]|uniref:Uncharacterized protein n=1 Tax=Phytophthora infestans TaxID=4787 RepID=A0A8S9V3U9_PHYIN|nr:hypothetical protein GN958_ATG13146 [Phytophthora infestans]KAF4140079.1 hypothetical protein GN958_ATG10731 [Phytophthora infestans]KAF4146052.1 hypothetical protein GN958_ATG04718 [Phytophthora infestans]
MALTRAQAAAAAAAAASGQVNEVTDAETAMVEHVGTDLTSSSALPLAPSVADHLASLAQHFIAQTQTLAAEHVALQQQQQGHSHAQNAALVAMQVSTEANLRQLTDQQRAIVERLGEALTATQSNLQDQLHHLQTAQDERGGQIEQFVNNRVAHALQEVQKESQREASSQIQGVHKMLEEIEAKVNSGLENLSQYVQQLVEDKVTASRLSDAPDDLSQYVQQLVEDKVTASRLSDAPDDGTILLIQKEVEAATSSIASSIKTSLQLDLQTVCDTIRQELLVRVDSAEEPRRQALRALVMEITTDAERRLEARMQRALTNTQSELNLQVQRQADATSALCEQVRKLSVRSKRQVQQNDESVLESTIADLVQKAVDQRIKAQQDNELCRSDANYRLQQELHTQLQDSRNSIDRSLQSAVGEIQRSIRDEVRGAVVEGTKLTKVPEANPGCKADELDDDIPATDEDFELEKRMQEAWWRSYMQNMSSVPADSPTTIGSDVPDVVEEKAPTASPERDRLSTIERETKETLPPLAELPQLQGGLLQSPPPPNVAVLQRIGSDSHGQRLSRRFLHQQLLLSQPQQPPNAGIVQRTDTHSQRLSRRSQRQSRTRELDLRVIVSEIQLQVQERAELAAQRYQSHRSYEE